MQADAPTAVPTVLAALTTLATTALPDVQVIDGPPGSQVAGDDVLCIGWSDGTTPAALANRETPDYGGRQREEGDVVCVADCYSGDRDFPALRARAGAILRTIYAQLQAQPGIAGAVDAAWLGEATEWAQMDTADGCAVRVSFSVHYVAEM